MLYFKIYIEKESHTIFTEEDMEKVLNTMTEDAKESQPFKLWLDDAYEPSEVYDLIFKEGNDIILKQEYDKFIDSQVIKQMKEQFDEEYIGTDFYYNKDSKRVYFNE
jgi:hypothetical protein